MKDLKLNKIYEKAKEKDVPIIFDEGLEVLLKTITENNVKRILEIGTAVGYSSIKMASLNEDIIIDTIERDKKMFDEALKNIEEMNLSKQINIFFNDALLINLSELKSEYDLIFIDAAKAQYQKFFEKFTPLLRKGGIVFTDNLLFHGLVKKYENKIEFSGSKSLKTLVKKISLFNEWLLNNQEYDTTFLNVGDGIAVSVKK